MDPEQKPVATLLLHRIGDVTLKCIRAGRPLVHTMRVWAIVGPHFMEAACHKDQAISKKAIACIHDSVTALLNEQVELPHFHFNEALFKPFENLLCLELCDFDVQVGIIIKFFMLHLGSIFSPLDSYPADKLYTLLRRLSPG